MKKPTTGNSDKIDVANIGPNDDAAVSSMKARGPIGTVHICGRVR